jgi:hypothetical protein
LSSSYFVRENIVLQKGASGGTEEEEEAGAVASTASQLVNVTTTTTTVTTTTTREGNASCENQAVVVNGNDNANACGFFPMVVAQMREKIEQTIALLEGEHCSDHGLLDGLRDAFGMYKPAPSSLTSSDIITPVDVLLSKRKSGRPPPAVDGSGKRRRSSRNNSNDENGGYDGAVIVKQVQTRFISNKGKDKDTNMNAAEVSKRRRRGSLLPPRKPKPLLAKKQCVKKGKKKTTFSGYSGLLLRQVFESYVRQETNKLVIRFCRAFSCLLFCQV